MTVRNPTVGSGRHVLAALVGGACVLGSGAARAADICDAINALNSYKFGGIAPLSSGVTCSSPARLDTYYHGSQATTGTVNDLHILPYVRGSAFFCALGDIAEITDAANTTANATFNALGTFGVKSRVRVVQRNPTLPLRIERTGELHLFGAKMTIERQDTEWKFPSELQGTGPEWGGYMTVTREGLDWDVPLQTVNFKIPAGPGLMDVKLGIELHSKSPGEKMGNNLLVSPTGNPPRNPTRAFSYADWLTCHNGGLLCGGTPADLIADHLRDCPLTFGTACDNTGDSFLPYLGAYGGAGPRMSDYVFHSPFVNWLHFGHTGKGFGLVDLWQFAIPGLAPEPSGNLSSVPFEQLRSVATTWGKMNVDVAYSAGFASIELGTATTLAVRDGFAVREREALGATDGHGPATDDASTVWTSVDAQSLLKVVVTAKVDFGLVEFSKSFTVANNETGQTSSTQKKMTEISYALDDRSEFLAYQVGPSALSPEAARGTCIAPNRPAKTATPTPVGNVGSFVEDAAKRSISAVHPCHINYCEAGIEIHAEWNPAILQVAVTGVSVGCNLCNDTMELCDAAGNALPNTLFLWDRNGDEGTQCIQ